jgi:hypothetical protein
MKSFFTSLIMLVVVQAGAQTVEFIEPRHVQTIPRAEFSTFQVKDRLYVLHKQYRMQAPVSFDLQLDVYDGARKPVASNTIDKTMEMGDANIYEGIFPMKEQLVLFKSEFSKVGGNKVSNLFYYPFDANGQRKKKTLLTSFPAEAAMNSGYFEVATSPAGTRLAVISELPYDKEGMEKCIVRVYDESFHELWTKEYSFPYESAKAPKNDIFVNDEGTVFILKRIKQKKKFDQFSVFSFTGNGQTVSEKKLELGNAFTISTYKSMFTPSGELVLAGYYYTDKNVGINVETPDGCFYVRVNGSTGELVAAKANPFKPLENLVALQLIALPDNSIALLGEQQYVRSVPIPGKMFEYNYEYTTRNSVLLKLLPDGTMPWYYTVAKELKSVNDAARFLSSYAWASGDDVHLLFADFLVERSERKHIVVLPNLGLTGARVNVIETIGADGKFKRGTYVKDIRIGGRSGEYMFIPATGTAFNGSVFLLSGRGGELVGTSLVYQ